MKLRFSLVSQVLFKNVFGLMACVPFISWLLRTFGTTLRQSVGALRSSGTLRSGLTSLRGKAMIVSDTSSRSSQISTLSVEELPF